MSRKNLDEIVDDLIADCHVPHSIPRRKMWHGIDRERAPRRGVTQAAAGDRPRVFGIDRRFWWPVAAAAVLLVGVAIGRFALIGNSGTDELVRPLPAVASAENTGPDNKDLLIYRETATAVFSRAETMLIDFRLNTAAADTTNRVPTWAGCLLTETRLLLDSPAVADPELKSLLQDLELVLAQIVQTAGARHPQDRQWIRRGLETRATMDRLRAATRSGSQVASI